MHQGGLSETQAIDSASVVSLADSNRNYASYKLAAIIVASIISLCIIVYICRTCVCKNGRGDSYTKYNNRRANQIKITMSETDKSWVTNQDSLNGDPTRASKSWIAQVRKADQLFDE